jgi:hypothetical protein
VVSFANHLNSGNIRIADVATGNTISRLCNLKEFEKYAARQSVCEPGLFADDRFWPVSYLVINKNEDIYFRDYLLAELWAPGINRNFR